MYFISVQGRCGLVLKAFLSNDVAGEIMRLLL